MSSEEDAPPREAVAHGAAASEALALDSRWLSLPLLLLACGLQYTRFAKKPMSAPFHRLSERLARRMVFVGLFAELLSLRFLPLCEAYPMNASCLLFLYFWKESKRSREAQRSEVLACLAALSVWALPFLNPADSSLRKHLEVSTLTDLMMAPTTCAYVLGVLALSVLAHCLGQGSALGSCTPAGMNFAASALLMKALAYSAGLCFDRPERCEAWALVVLDVALLLGLRGAAAVPLRKALEAYDNLSVLAFYGAVSSAAAASTGQVVFGEMDAWELEHKAAYLTIAFCHVWGMLSLGCRGGERVTKDKEDRGKPTELGKGIEMQKQKPPSPLLTFKAAQRSVDEDAQMEEKLFAHALGVSEPNNSVWSAAWPDSPAGPAAEAGNKAPAIVEADFEELMRRFGEDEEGEGRITDLPPEPKAATIADATPPGLLAYDAQTLLEDAEGDEDELLKSIEDIPGVIDIDEL